MRTFAPCGHVATVTLQARVAVGLGWTGGAHWFGVAVSTVTTIVVARLLVPADFAVVAAAGALTGVLGILQESGLAAAVVQHDGDADRAATTAFAINLAAATAGVAVCVALTPWLADYFHIGGAGPLAVAFAPLWLKAWMNAPLARLQRALDFRRCALVEVVETICYPVVTIPLALEHTGAWALVLGQAAATAAGALAAWVLTPWRPRFAQFDWATARALVRYGRPLTWSNLLGMVNDRIDNWVTGRVLGPVALGVYAMSFRLATLPRTGFTYVVSRVLFPTLAALHGDERRFRAAFLRSLHWVAALAMPASAGLALLAPEIVAVVLGPRWAGAVTPLRVLSGFALFAALSATTGDVFKASGRSTLIFRIGLVHSAALWSGLWLLAPRGTAWVALAVTVATALSSSTAFACALAVLGVGPGALVRALWAPAAATAVLGATVAAARSLPLAGGAAALGAVVLLGTVVYAVALAILAPGDVHELGAALAAIRARRSPRATATARA